MFKKILIIAAAIVVIIIIAISTFVFRALSWEETAIHDRLASIPLIQHELEQLNNVVINELAAKGEAREVLIELEGTKQTAQLIGVINATESTSEYEFTGHIEIDGQHQPIRFIYSGIASYSGNIQYRNGTLDGHIKKHEPSPVISTP